MTDLVDRRRYISANISAETVDYYPPPVMMQSLLSHPGITEQESRD